MMSELVPVAATDSARPKGHGFLRPECLRSIIPAYRCSSSSEPPMIFDVNHITHR